MLTNYEQETLYGVLGEFVERNSFGLYVFMRNDQLNKVSRETVDHLLKVMSIIRSIAPRGPIGPFICGVSNDHERVYVCPQYGSDLIEVYVKE